MIGVVMIAKKQAKSRGRIIRDKIKDELESRKTREMKLIERIYDQDIYILIAPRSNVSAKDIALSLDITESTVSKWRSRLGMTDVRRIKPGPKTV